MRYPLLKGDPGDPPEVVSSATLELEAEKFIRHCSCAYFLALK